MTYRSGQSKPASRTPHRPLPRVRPALLCLEERAVPAILTVTTLTDSTALVGSLRSEITAAAPGDTIQFDPRLRGGTLHLMGGELLLAKNLTIQGLGAADLAISGDNVTRLFAVTASVTLSGLTLTQAQGSGTGTFVSGGAITNTGTLVLSGCAVTDNTIVGSNTSGAGVYNTGTLFVNACTFSGNTVGFNGGGIYNDVGGTATVTDSIFTGNTAGQGGGISSYGMLTVTRGLFLANAAGPASNGFGGGLFNNGAGTAQVIDSTFTGNTSTGGGGGLDNNASASTLMVTGCTINGNTASHGGGGGGIFNGTGGLGVTNSTIVDNTALNGGGGLSNLGNMVVVNSTLTGNTSTLAAGGGVLTLDLTGVSTTLRNTIVARNTGPGGSASDIGGIGVTAGSVNNLVGTGGSGGLADGVNGNIVGVADPRLGTLGDYGGPTFTVPLLPGSRALDAGTSVGAPLVDQRGVVRGGGVNIGAYQATAAYFELRAPVAVTAGAAFTVSVVARDFYGPVAVGYVGTAYLNSTDPQNPYMDGHDFTPADAGVFSFTGEQLFTAGPQLLIVRDPNIVGVLTLKVDAAAATQLLLTASDAIVSGGVAAGTPFTVTVAAYDAYGNLANSDVALYRGTVHFSSSDGAAVLPDDHPFTADDQATHSFMVTLNTPGVVTLTVADLADPTLTSTLTLYVF